MTQPDLFERFADSRMSKGHRRANEAETRREAARAAKAAIPPMVLQGLEKAQAEKAKQLIRYRQWKAEVREGLTRGDYGPEIVGLLKHLRKPTRAAGLLDYILAAKWLTRCSTDVRETLLGYIDDAMIRHAIRNGYPPFNDAIGDEPLNDFLIIRRHLIGV